MGGKRWNVFLINALDSLCSQARNYNNCIRIWKLFPPRLWQAFFDSSQAQLFKKSLGCCWADIMNENGAGLGDGSFLYIHLKEKHHHPVISIFFPFVLKYHKNVHSVVAMYLVIRFYRHLWEGLHMSKLTLKVL